MNISRDGVPDRPNTRTDAVNYEGINQKQGSRKMRVAPEIFWEEGAYRSTNAEQVLRTSPPSRIKFEQAKRALTRHVMTLLYVLNYKKKTDRS